MRTVSETSGIILHASIFKLFYSQKKKKRWPEKTFGETIVNKFPNIGEGNSHSTPGRTESPIQYKPKEKHIKSHNNQTNKN